MSVSLSTATTDRDGLRADIAAKDQELDDLHAATGLTLTSAASRHINVLSSAKCAGTMDVVDALNRTVVHTVALGQRVTDVVGTAGSDVGAFAGSILTDNKSVVFIMQELSDALATETVRETVCKSTLAVDLTTETVREQSDEAAMTMDLSDEVSTAWAAEAQLQTNITTERQRSRPG